MENNITHLASEFISESIKRMQENTPRIRKCLEELSEEEIWHRPNGISNSTGNLILHLCGNITQYIIATLGETADLRERDKEFSAEGGLKRDELIFKLEEVVGEAIRIIQSQTPESLLKVRPVQVYNLTGVGIIVHVVEHYSYHTGQIIFWTKQLKNKDLGFYSGVDLNRKNS